MRKKKLIFILYCFVPNFSHFDESTGKKTHLPLLQSGGAQPHVNMRITWNAFKICWFQGPTLIQMMGISREGCWVQVSPGDPCTARVENSFPDSGQRWQLGKSEAAGRYPDTGMESQGKNKWVLGVIKGKSWGRDQVSPFPFNQGSKS